MKPSSVAILRRRRQCLDLGAGHDVRSAEPNDSLPRRLQIGARLKRTMRSNFFANGTDSDRLAELKDSIMRKKQLALAAALAALTLNLGAWDYEGHHAINELALA